MPRVTCINKTDRYNAWERIHRFGGQNQDGSVWRLSSAQMIAAIKSGEYGDFYVEQPRGDRVRASSLRAPPATST
jgi:hypothetical protein